MKIIVVVATLLYVLIFQPISAADSGTITFNMAVQYDRDGNRVLDKTDPGLGGQRIDMFVYPCNINDPACTSGAMLTTGHTDASGVVTFLPEETSWLIVFCYYNIYRFTPGCVESTEGIYSFGVTRIFNIYMPYAAN